MGFYLLISSNKVINHYDTFETLGSTDNCLEKEHWLQTASGIWRQQASACFYQKPDVGVALLWLSNNMLSGLLEWWLIIQFKESNNIFFVDSLCDESFLIAVVSCGVIVCSLSLSQTSSLISTSSHGSHSVCFPAFQHWASVALEIFRKWLDGMSHYFCRETTKKWNIWHQTSWRRDKEVASLQGVWKKVTSLSCTTVMSRISSTQWPEVNFQTPL